MGGAAVGTHVHGHGGHIQQQRRSYAQGHIRRGQGSRHERPISIIIHLSHFSLLFRSSTSAWRLPSPPSPSTAQPTSHSGRHQLQSVMRQTLHMSVALTMSVEGAHEAVEPTTMTMTSDEGHASRLHPTDQASSRASEQRTRRGKGPFVFPVSTTSSNSNNRCMAAFWMSWLLPSLVHLLLLIVFVVIGYQQQRLRP
ncbi:hypothetical protein PTSG_03882 [Salpingoeca rosetta]|uniref:Uncharacterized protein n=1 Tax=Salpingoeca rosetta (strain ATCC 50818 / BSB-021) TaxID=946362 RepID=F2U5N5_SALR5|nr:uncharacterized protein PTSG_03882 [Salpingoeca rosetta]EGD83251.1 hypothetical protein PTSG_03882 [Salpingoeca rosetta]|eukprot:XP_004995615.1 hypothetical protein PTSG_03882 [Salpingoeca rosetta]